MKERLFGRNLLAAAVVLAAGTFLIPAALGLASVAQADTPSDPFPPSQCDLTRHPDEFMQDQQFNFAGLNEVHIDPSLEGPALAVSIGLSTGSTNVCVATQDGQFVVATANGAYLNGCITVAGLGTDNVMVSRLPSCPLMTDVTVNFMRGQGNLEPILPDSRY